MVGMTVIAALELNEDVATGEATSHTDCRHGSLGSAVHEAKALHRWEGFSYLLGKGGFGKGRDAEAASVENGIGCRLAHLVVVMT